MIVALHKLARTTPAVRAEIASRNAPASQLARESGVTPATIYKWQRRESFEDRSHTAHRLQTTLTAAQEAIAVELRRTLLLPLDDLLAVVREFVCGAVSRSGLDRCLRRHGVGSLRALRPAEPKAAHAPPSRATCPATCTSMSSTCRRWPTSARAATCSWPSTGQRAGCSWPSKVTRAAASARSFLKALHRACPIRISRVLTDNGREFTDRLFASRERVPSGEHEFDRLCASLGIEHRLTKPRTPRTNGMVERFNGRISEVLRGHRFQQLKNTQ